MFVVWTASHIDSVDHLNFLLECIESVKNVGLVHYISLSHDPSIELPADLPVVIHKEKKSQFQHIEFLYKTRPDDE